MPRSRGEKARGYDVHKKEKHYMSYEKPHKKPIREDRKTHPVHPFDKRSAMVLLDVHGH